MLLSFVKEFKKNTSLRILENEDQTEIKLKPYKARKTILLQKIIISTITLYFLKP